jgi:NTE family protein
MQFPWNMKIGLVLGGGAARGFAHVGVIRALQREKIPVDIVVGASIGAIIGGSWAADLDVVGLEERVRKVLTSAEFRQNRFSFMRESRERSGGLLYSMGNLLRKGVVYGVSTMRSSFVSAEEFTSTLGGILPDIRVEDCRLPFGAVALDLESGDEIVLRHGSLRRAAFASAAIPGLLPPVHEGKRVLIDGGWIDKVPVLPAFRMGADVVLAVDISASLDDVRDYSKGTSIMVRANGIKDSVLVGFTRVLADIVIEPEVKDIHWADFDSFETCIQAGDDAATAAIPAIRKMIRREKWRGLIRSHIGRKLAERVLQDDHMHVVLD